MGKLEFDRNCMEQTMDRIVERTMRMDMTWDWPCGVAYYGIAEAYEATGKQEQNLWSRELHSSTQCDVRTPEKAYWLTTLGFKLRFLINRIAYPLRNNRFRKQTSRFPSSKTQDLNDGLD